MAAAWDEQQLIVDGFERVYVELEWYDGPRSGVADVDGAAHYFHNDDYAPVDEAAAYQVWPARAETVGLEREKWAIYARWSERCEIGAVGPDSHPGHGGTDARYDELTALLTPHRRAPADARRLAAEWRFVAGARYRADGVDYWVRWRPA